MDNRQNKDPKRIKQSDLVFGKKVPGNHTHEVSEVTRSNKPQKQKLYKSLGPKDKQEIAEIESFNSYCYLLLLGRNACKIRVVNREDDDIGVLIDRYSEFIPFISLLGFLKSENTRDVAAAKQVLYNSEICKIWTTAYIEEEVDLHPNNYGFEKKQAVKIDHGLSTISVTAHYHQGLSKKTKKKSDKIFPQYYKEIQADIRNFPELTYATPTWWPDKDSALCGNLALPSLRDISLELTSQKFYILLKRILIADSTYQAIADYTIRNQTLKTDLVNNKIRRTSQLRKALVVMPEFADYLENNQGVLVEIKTEFEKLDKKGKYKIDLDTIEKTYQDILRETISNKHTKKDQKTNSNKIETIENLLAKLAKHNPTNIADFLLKNVTIIKIFPSVDSILNLHDKFSGINKSWCQAIEETVFKPTNPLLLKEIIRTNQDFSQYVDSLKSKYLDNFIDILETNLDFFKSFLQNYFGTDSNSTSLLKAICTMHLGNKSSCPNLYKFCETHCNYKITDEVMKEYGQTINLEPDIFQKHWNKIFFEDISSNKIATINKNDSKLKEEIHLLRKAWLPLTNREKEALIKIIEENITNIEKSSKILNSADKTIKKKASLEDFRELVKQADNQIDFAALVEEKLQDKDITCHRRRFTFFMSADKQSKTEIDLRSYYKTHIKRQ